MKVKYINSFFFIKNEKYLSDFIGLKINNNFVYVDYYFNDEYIEDLSVILNKTIIDVKISNEIICCRDETKKYIC